MLWGGEVAEVLKKKTPNPTDAMSEKQDNVLEHEPGVSTGIVFRYL